MREEKFLGEKASPKVYQKKVLKFYLVTNIIFTKELHTLPYKISRTQLFLSITCYSQHQHAQESSCQETKGS